MVFSGVNNCGARLPSKQKWCGRNVKTLRLASLERRFPSLLNAKEDEELFYDKERVVKKVKPEQVYVFWCFLRACALINGSCSRIGGVRLKPCDNNGDLMSPVLHDTVVRPKEPSAAILAQVNQEMARIKERDHH